MAAEQPHIRIRGARVHNLKSVDLDLPLHQLICFAGPSGSGKTSLAFHTLLSESRRRFVNSFPNSMKFFADRPSAVDVDEIFPVLPVFGLPQINPVMGARSLVADVMRTTELLQGLYFNYAREYCPTHNLEVQTVGFSQMLGQASQAKPEAVWHLLVERELGQALLGESFAPPRSWSVKKKSIGEFEPTDDYWEVLRFKQSTLASLDVKNADVISKVTGRPLFLWSEGQKKLTPFSYQSKKRCPRCDFAGKSGITASAFTPHSALGACKACNGYGANLVYDDNKLVDRDLSFEEGGVSFLNFGPLDWWKKEFVKAMKRHRWSLSEPLKTLPKEFFRFLQDGEKDWEGFVGVKAYLESKRYKPAVRVFIRKLQKEVTCGKCRGTRLDPLVENFKIPLGNELVSLFDFAGLSLSDFHALLERGSSLPENHAQKVIKQLAERSGVACQMGLNHLTHDRKTRSLSAGEYQRLLILKYLSFDGTDALFVLDEPSLGLGEKEQAMLIQGLRQIIAQGNTVLVVDHSEQMQQASDHLVILGPGSGQAGGEVLYQGPTKKWRFPAAPALPEVTSSAAVARGEIKVKGASTHGHQWGDFTVPTGQLVWARGPSGSGKTSCLVNVLAQELHKRLFHENLVDEPGRFQAISGATKFEDVIVVDANLNRFTSRSSVGSLTDLAPAVRKHFLKLPVAKSMGLKDGHLSPNSELGMCPRCEGKGHLIIEMQYLEDIVLPCEDCKGKRIKPLYAEISDGHMSVSDAFNKPLTQVLPRVELTPKYRRTWEYMKILNVDYLSLERPLNTLSGGERQRLYLLSRLLKEVTSAFVVFENLSFGLSAADIVRLGGFLRDLAWRGNTLVVIDSDPLFAKMCHSEMEFTPEGIRTRALKH